MSGQSKRTAFVIDLVILAFVLFALAIDLTGGFYYEPFGWRVSARRPERPLLLAVILGVIRWRWWGSHEFLLKPLGPRLFHAGADDAGADPPSTSRRHFFLASAGLIGVACLMLQAQLRQMTSVPDLGDPIFSMWRMGWIYRQLLGDPRALFDANIFHPVPMTLTFSESMLLPSLIAAPLFAAGLQPAFIYNTLLIAGFPASGIATYLLLSRLVRSPGAAFAGALFYMCHPYRLEHYSHFEQLLTMWMPLALWATIRFGETRKLRFGLAAAVFAAAQWYSSMYYGMYFPFYLVAVVGALAIARRWDWRRLLRPALISAGVAALLVLPLARMYMAAQPLKGDRDKFVVEYYSAEITDYLRPHERLATHAGRWLEANRPERALFPGVTPLILSGIALAPPLGPIRLAFGTGLLAAFDLSRGMKGHVYPLLYDFVPPIRGTRVPARFAIILGISLAVLTAFGVRRLLSRWSGWRRHAVLAGIVGLMLVDLRPGLDLYPVWPDIPRIYQQLHGRSGVVLAEIPFEIHEPWVTSEVPYEYFSISHGHQMVNGYSGFSPDGYHALVQRMRRFPDADSIQALRERGVTHVSINCAFIGDECRDMLNAMDQTPALKLVTVAHWQNRKERGLRPTRLYELAR